MILPQLNNPKKSAVLRCLCSATGIRKWQRFGRYMYTVDILPKAFNNNIIWDHFNPLTPQLPEAAHDRTMVLLPLILLCHPFSWQNVSLIPNSNTRKNFLKSAQMRVRDRELGQIDMWKPYQIWLVKSKEKSCLPTTCHFLLKISPSLIAFSRKLVLHK